MKLRPELIPNASKERINTVRYKIKEILQHLNNAKYVEPLIHKLNEFCFRNYDKAFFDYLPQEEKIEDLARDFAQIPAKKTYLREDELAELIRRIRQDDPNSHFYYEVIDINIDYGAASEIIDFPENQGLKSPEDIAFFIQKCRSFN